MFRNEALEPGRFKRAPDPWQIEFGRWVADFGVPRLVAGLAQDPDLRVTNRAAHEWLQACLTFETSPEAGEPHKNTRASCPHFGDSPPLCPLEAVRPADGVAM